MKRNKLKRPRFDATELANFDAIQSAYLMAVAREMREARRKVKRPRLTADERALAATFIRLCETIRDARGKKPDIIKVKISPSVYLFIVLRKKTKKRG